MNLIRYTSLAVAAIGMSWLAHAGAQETKSPPTLIADPLTHVDLPTFVKMPAVLRELKLSEAQITELDAIDEETKRHVSSVLRGLSNLTPDEKKAAFRDIQQHMSVSRELCTGVFSPEQLHRTKQLILQFVSRRPSTGYGLLGSAMVEELKITDEQATTIREKSAEIDKKLKSREIEVKRELEALRIKLQTELIDSLDLPQRSRVKLLFGELITLEN